MASQMVSFDASSNAQASFASNYDLDKPVAAISSYSRSMHQHTQQQMDSSTGRTKQEEGVNSMGKLGSGGSANSVDSMQ